MIEPSRLLVSIWLACHAAAVAAGPSAAAPGGGSAALVEGVNGARAGYYLERRSASGVLELQFGRSGRSFFVLNEDNSAPAAVAVDAADRIVVVGSTPLGDGRTAVTTLRFLPSGQPDPGWGSDGRSDVTVPHGDGVAAAVLPLPGGGVLVAGTVESTQGLHATLWRLRDDGTLDTHFGEWGRLQAVHLPGSQSLSLHQDSDGALQIGLQVRSDDAVWFEVHRWTPGTDAPLRYARQALPLDQIGRPALTLRLGRWVWAEAGHVDGPARELQEVTAQALWTSGTGVPNAGSLDSLPSPASGHALLNPFAERGEVTLEGVDVESDAPAWSTLASLLSVAFGGILWWRRRF